jgi:hypothetical protein
MKLKLATLIPVAILVAGCSTLPGGVVTPSMSDSDYVKAAPEAREAYLKAIREESEALTLKKTAEYQAERPVYYGDKVTGFTMLWNKKLQMVSVYPGHVSNPMGMETSSILVLRTDSEGGIHYQNQGGVEKPTTLLANVANQEGLSRLLLKGGLQVLGASVNGALAAKIAADASCGNNCGNLTLIQQAQGGAGGTGGQAGAYAEGGKGGEGGVGVGYGGSGGYAVSGSVSQSQAGSTVDVNAVLGGCPSGGTCVPVPVW